VRVPLVKHARDPPTVRGVQDIALSTARSRGEVTKDKADPGSAESLQLGIGL